MRRPSWQRWLAGAAALAGALAPFAGSPYRRADRAQLARAAAPDVTRDPAYGATARGANSTTPDGVPALEGLRDGPMRPDLGHAESGDHTRSPGELARGALPATVDVAELAKLVAEQRDHLPAVELAAWIRAGKPGLRIIDLRTPTEFAAFHIPGAEHVAIEDLARTPFGAGDTIVAYSEVGVHGGQAWVLLRALGHRQVFFLRDGLHEWLDDVMSPTLPADASAEVLAAFERTAELSRAFGGTPRKLTAAAPAGEPISPRRRGC